MGKRVLNMSSIYRLNRVGEMIPPFSTPFLILILSLILEGVVSPFPDNIPTEV